jgi:Ca-activated chloride channel family protein
MNNLIKYNTVLILKLLVFGSFYSQSIESRLILKEGNNSYKKGDFKNSSNSYINSIAEDQNNLDAIYNNGNSYMMSGDFKGARENFNNYITKSKSNTDKAKAHYNIGNSYLTQYAKETKEGGQPSSEYLESAVNEYKKSLRHNPKDSDARYNLSYALKMMQNQQNKDQNKKDQDNKDQDKKDQDKKDQDNKDQQNKDQDNKDQQNKDQDKKEQEKKEQEKKEQEKKEQDKKEPKEKKPNESKEQAIKNLDAINGDEEKVLLKVNRKKGNQKKKSKTKDW